MASLTVLECAFPARPNSPVLYRQLERLIGHKGEAIEIGIVLLLVGENAVEEMRRSKVVRNALTRTVVVVGHCKDFFKTWLGRIRSHHEIYIVSGVLRSSE